MTVNPKQHAFNLFEAYLTYALDENHEQAQMGYLFRDGFNEDKFFSKYYVARKLKEDELEHAITLDNCHIFFVGQPGSGKTTLVRKVLHKVEHEKGVFVINVDFKKRSAANMESKISFTDMQEYIIENIMASVSAEIIKQKIDQKEVILDLIANSDYLESNNFDNAEFIAAMKNAYNEYCFETSEPASREAFVNWFRDKLFQRKGDEFKAIYERLNDTLKPQNLLYYLCTIRKVFPYCVLAFDNLDSIGDKELRKSFITVFRQTFNVYKPTTKLIAIIRSRNIRSQPGDPGTYIINEIGLDYLEFTEAAESSKNDSVYASAENLKFHKKGKEKFAKLIYESRLQYLKSEVFKTDQVDLSGIEEFFDVVYNNERLNVSFFDLCNYDRRVMLIEISDFIRYLAFDLSIELSDPDKNREQIDFALESLFYGWIKRKRKFYEDSIYNLPKDVRTWQQNKQKMGCSVDHLIFACIFNLTGQDCHDYVFEKQTTIEGVISKMGEIGYGEDEIKARIWYLYRDAITLGYKGLLEISSMEDPDPIKLGINDYGISLTPRSYYMVVYSSLKYVSVLADIYGEEVVAGNTISIRELSDDTKPLTARKLYACMQFLCNLAQMHLHGLMIARNKLYPRHKAGWFKFYRENFCIRPNPEDPYKDGGGELLFLNLNRSICKFLKNQRLDPSEVNSKLINGLHPVIDQLIELEKFFEKEVTKLIQMEEEVIPVKLFDFARKIQFDIFNDR